MNNEIKIDSAQTIGEVRKNSDGHLGPRCNWCGGYGFTNNLKGGSDGCPKCEGSGIETPTKADLLKRIADLETKK